MNHVSGNIWTFSRFHAAIIAVSFMIITRLDNDNTKDNSTSTNTGSTTTRRYGNRNHDNGAREVDIRSKVAFLDKI